MYRSFEHACQQLAQIEAVDYFLAREICTLYPALDQTALFHLVLAVSESLRQGHSCVVLTQLAQQHLWQDGELHQAGYQFADIVELQHQCASLTPGDSNPGPLILQADRLYLRRYWQFETDLALHLQNKMQPQAVSDADVKALMAKLFPDLSDDIDWQYVAVANALNKSFSVIAGGPGTGKTFTVTKLLAALVMLFPQQTKMAMVAPTGKAAQRLSESIIAAVQRFANDGLIDTDVLAKIPTEASTIHRLLGVLPGNPNFRHDQSNPLDLDLLLIDEASMVDLPMMTRVFRALPAHCRVILLGDADQLPSVAAGSVLADLAPRPHPGYQTDNHRYLSHVSPWQLPLAATDGCDYLTILQKSRRFSGDGGIGRLARQVIAGQATQSWYFLKDGQDAEVSLVIQSFDTWLESAVLTHYAPMFAASSLQHAFAYLNKFRILVAMRLGEQGLETINAQVERILSKHNIIKAGGSLYPGRPIMITQNHYGLQLFNGDIGILWPNQDGVLMAYFPLPDETFRPLAPSRLPHFETVYAMTIHKTQGSEFNHVALVLPIQHGSQLLSRELIYTGLTRAKEKLSICTDEQVWKHAVHVRVERCSGLMAQLQLASD